MYMYLYMCMYMYIYVCMYVCMYVCIYIYIYICARKQRAAPGGFLRRRPRRRGGRVGTSAEGLLFVL